MEAFTVLLLTGVIFSLMLLYYITRYYKSYKGQKQLIKQLNQEEILLVDMRLTYEDLVAADSYTTKCSGIGWHGLYDGVAHTSRDYITQERIEKLKLKTNDILTDDEEDSMGDIKKISYRVLGFEIDRGHTLNVLLGDNSKYIFHPTHLKVTTKQRTIQLW